MTAPSPTLTPEQLAVVEATKRSSKSLLVSACAGSGKTTTLKAVGQALPLVPTLALAFNKRNAVDLERSMPGYVRCSTFNALGHGAWTKTIGTRPQVNKRKLGTLVGQALKEERDKSELGPDGPLIQWHDLLRLVNFGRASGLIPPDRGPEPEPDTWGIAETPETWRELALDLELSPSPRLLSLASTVLHESITLAFAGHIDFDDQLYMPLGFANAAAFPSFSTILVDEAQDLSPGNHEMLRRSVKPDGRVIAVGDPAQAIYAFRGADSQSMPNLAQEWDMTALELSVTFRCDQAIVTEAQRRLPSMKARAGAGPGLVRRVDTSYGADIFPHHCAILCRNNAPLMAAGFRLIRAGRGVTFIGADLGKTLLKILAGLGSDDTPHATAETLLAEWLETQITWAEENNRPGHISRSQDKHDCLIAAFYASHAESIGQAKDHITRLFQEENGTIILSTGHRSKGSEWDTVFHLDPWRIPSKYARKARDAGNPEPFQQERNLAYVITTRARHELVFINSADWEPEPEPELIPGDTP